MSLTSFEPTGCTGDDSGGSQVLGGYQPVSDFESDEEVTAAASFAFEDFQSPDSKYAMPSDVVSYEVVGASEQVVAGLNIELDMIFLDSEGNCVEAATVVVYDHFGDMSITSFEVDENGCEGANSAPMLTGESDTADISSAYNFNARGSLVSLMALAPLILMLQF